MPKKHKQEDLVFIKEFSRQLNKHYEIARREGVAHEDFAESLELSRTALQDYLDGKRMPTVRSLALAVERYGIDVPYQGTNFRAKGYQETEKAEEQLSLPVLLVLPSDKTSLKLGPVTANTVSFTIQSKKSAG